MAALAAPIGPILSGNFHLSHWADRLRDRTAFRFKKFQLVGELQTLYSDRFQLLPFKEQGFYSRGGLWESEATDTLCSGRF